jgi:photosystem II stability/assembly factor-like uncharacterized protein
MSRLSLALVSVLVLVSPLSAAWRSEGPFIGAVVDVAIDPVKPETIYAATGSGGVWRSDDGGQHWMLPGTEMVSRPVTWIEVDPGNTSTLYAGVHNPGEAGLWRSTDRGANWKPVRPDRASYMLDQPIAFAPSNPKIVYAPSTNLHYRSADGGKTWESFRVPDQDVYAFAIDPKNPKIIYGGGRGTEHQMRKSIDGGKTWKPVGEGLPEKSINRVLIPREQPSTIYVATGFGQLFKSEDAGDSWTELDAGLTGTDDLFSLDLDPHDPNTLIAGTENGLRKSTDGGQSWSTIGGGLGNWYCKGVAFHPKKEGVVYAGTTGKGFFISNDGGETFTPSSNGLAAGWVEKLFVPPNGSGPVFAQSGVGLYRQDAPGTWTEIQAPFKPGSNAEIDGVVYDRQSPKTIYAHEGAKWWRSDDSGRAWRAIEVPQPGMRDLMKGKLSGPSFDALAQDLGDAKVFYAGGSWMKETGGSAVNKSIDGGKKWTAAGAGITGDVTLLRAAAPNILYAVTKDGLFRTADGAKSWALVRKGEIEDLAVDATRAFVATKQGFYRSTDAGVTWTRLTKGIAEDEIEGVALTPSTVFCATFGGVFYSTDDGHSFVAMNDGLLNTDVRVLAVSGGAAPRLYAGTAGGSVWSIEVP